MAFFIFFTLAAGFFVLWSAGSFRHEFGETKASYENKARLDKVRSDILLAELAVSPGKTDSLIADFRAPKTSDVPFSGAPLKRYSDLYARYNTYLYVIESAHKELEEILISYTDKAYFSLVAGMDSENSVPAVINQYVTPLVSLTQIRADMNFLLANLEKTRATDANSSLYALRASSAEALKRIEAAFNLHKDNPEFTEISDITYQITSFAQGPNNIFDIRHELIALEHEILSAGQVAKKQLDQAEAAHIRDIQQNNQKVSVYSQRIIWGIGFLLLATLFLAVLNYGYHVIHTSSASPRSDRPAASFAARQPLFSKAKLTFQALANWIGKNLRRTHKRDNGGTGMPVSPKMRLKNRGGHNTLSRFGHRIANGHSAFKKRSGTQSVSALQPAHSPKQDDDDSLFSNEGIGSSDIDGLLEGKSALYKWPARTQPHKEDDIKPLLLDTTMRINAQREQLKHALAKKDPTFPAKTDSRGKTEYIDSPLDLDESTTTDRPSRNNQAPGSAFSAA